MGKKTKDKGSRKERRRAAALAGTEIAGDLAALAASPGLVSPLAALDSQGVLSSAGRSSARHPAADAAELAARLASLGTIMQRQLARADAGDGLTRARLSALALLVLGGPKTLGELAAAESVRPPTMTRLVHAMEADGLVVRERNPVDGRSVIISATPIGEAQLEQGRSRQIVPLTEAIAQLDGAERLQIGDAADLLGRVLRAASRGTAETAETAK